MNRHLHTALLIALPMAMAALPAIAAKPASTAPATQAAERDTLDGIVAAALVGALSEQLGGRPVKVRLGRIDVRATSLRDRVVSGQGELQIDGAPEWLGFRFSTLYDSLYESAGYPELSIGTVGPEGRAVPNDSSLIREAEDRVVAQLSREFGYQKVWLQLDRIATVESGRRYLRIDASGTADFGRDGAAPARIEGLYDREQKVWLRVAYVLESALPQPPPSAG
ncbi:MAG: hypothetical protein KF800_06210 [Lysobacter sp.]|nr:hypothetical protein [Lysobacter sp.]